jgi:hypothetical protein
LLWPDIGPPEVSADSSKRPASALVSTLVAAPAALAGFIVNPAWFIWLGLTLRRD